MAPTSRIAAFILCIIFVAELQFISCTDYRLLFAIRNEQSSYNSKRFNVLRLHLIEQGVENSSIKSFTNISKNQGDILILPILKEVADTFPNNDWLIVCSEETRFNIKFLRDKLSNYNAEQVVYFGLSLKDKEPVIIHHFDDLNDFAYPYLHSGIVFSKALLKLIAISYEDYVKTIDDFSIDFQYELAKYIKKITDGVTLTSANWLCTDYDPSACASYLPNLKADCGYELNDSEYFVGVKTCEKFHKNRVKVVLDTWYKQIRNSNSIRFFSDAIDKSIPNIIKTKSENTESGHCAKMFEILETFSLLSKNYPFKWLVISDDDTILNIKRLRKLLHCYDANEAVAIGEKYGFALLKRHGYSYLTGGGGIVLSKPAVDLIMSCHYCRCPADNSPDDMMLGIWMPKLNISMIHSHLFHQARPYDYADIFIKSQTAVSFHKHWMIDPVMVFHDFLHANNYETDTPKDEL